MELQDVRKQFPHTDDLIYLNHAATGPLARRTKAAIDHHTAKRHRGAINLKADALSRVEETRELVAWLVGASKGRIALTNNTSSGLNVAALGIPWERGDRIAVPSCEFPANVYPFLNLQNRGVVVDFIPHQQGVFTLDQIDATLRPETRMLTLSWVQFLSGFRTDLDAVADLCDSRDVLLCVDAIQGLGALQLDVERSGIDILACGSHKWLMSTQGIGFLYVSEPVQEIIEPPMAGWLHGPVDWDRLFDYELAFHEDARRFHLGTMNHGGIAALHAALNFYFECGPAWCEQQVAARASQIADGLSELGFERYGPSGACRSGIVTVEAPGAEGLQAHLEDHAVACAVRNGKLRFSPTWYNSRDEIRTALALCDDYNG